MEAFSAWLVTVFVFSLLADEPAVPPPAAKETIVLLPDDEGKRTGIVVKSQGQEIAVTEPYQGVELSGDKVESKTYTAAQIQSMFPGVMQALPDKPRSFTLRFEQNGTRLTAESAAMVEEIRQEITKRAAPEVTVIGHTDREGSDDANLRLSQSRAEAMRDILVAGGVSAQIIQVVGRGELEPEVMTADGIAEPRNRRVEISVR
ncbi:MAG: OmpA family protein [Nitrosomonadales bacterium]|nr:OmpA family protein [Nitrosomonadales bacterium]